MRVPQGCGARYSSYPQCCFRREKNVVDVILKYSKTIDSYMYQDFFTSVIMRPLSRVNVSVALIWVPRSLKLLTSISQSLGYIVRKRS